MATETPVHGAPGRTNDIGLKEQSISHDRHQETTDVITSNKPANGISVEPPSPSEAALLTNAVLSTVNKNGRSTGDTSNTRTKEQTRENTLDISSVDEGALAATGTHGNENMDNVNKHNTAVNNGVGTNGIPQMNATMIDAAITLDNTFTPQSGIDKLLPPQSNSLFVQSIDPKLPGSAVMHATATPAIHSKFIHGAVAYGSTGNFGVSHQPGYDDAILASSMLPTNANYQNGFHASGSHIDVDHSAYGNLFTAGAANSGVGGMGGDFAGPSQPSMSMAPQPYSNSRYGLSAPAAAPSTPYNVRFGEQGIYGYHLGQMDMAQRPDVSQHTLMALDDALDRNTITRSPRRGDEDEIIPSAAESGNAVGSANGEGSKKAPSRRKGGRGGRKADDTDLRLIGKKVPSRARAMHSSTHISAEEKRRIRAERNRESAEKSRLRHKQRTEELERDVYNKRIENREVKASIDTYYAQLRGVADTIEKGTTRDDAVKKVPALYNALNSMSKAIEQCVWTYRDPREPEIQLKIGRP